MNTQKILDEFANLGHSDKYDKVIVVLGLLQNKPFELQQLAVMINLLDYHDMSEQELVTIYQTLLELKAIAEAHTEAQKDQTYQDKVQFLHQLMVAHEKESENDAPDADDLLSQI